MGVTWLAARLGSARLEPERLNAAGLPQTCGPSARCEGEICMSAQMAHLGASVRPLGRPAGHRGETEPANSDAPTRRVHYISSLQRKCSPCQAMSGQVSLWPSCGATGSFLHKRQPVGHVWKPNQPLGEHRHFDACRREWHFLAIGPFPFLLAGRSGERQVSRRFSGPVERRLPWPLAKSSDASIVGGQSPL